MIRGPFSLFRQFPEIDIRMLCKADDIVTDEQMAARWGVDGVVSPEQVHGSSTAIVRSLADRADGADGVVTDPQGLPLAIRFADCQNFIVYAPAHHVIGLLHVGWRGLGAGAIPALYSTLKREWGIEPRETYIAAGPSLCERCSEFSDPRRELPTIPAEFIHGRCVDLCAAADAQLQDLGIPPSQRERHEDCTKCRSELYFTYRGGDREAVKSRHENALLGMMLPRQ